MLLHGFFSKFKSSLSRREVLRACIEGLQIDSTQKELFMGSIEFLDDNGVEALYQRISTFISEVEFLKIKSEQLDSKKSIATGLKKEQEQTEKERNSFKILLDTI